MSEKCSVNIFKRHEASGSDSRISPLHPFSEYVHLRYYVVPCDWKLISNIIMISLFVQACLIIYYLNGEEVFYMLLDKTMTFLNSQIVTSFWFLIVALMAWGKLPIFILRNSTLNRILEVNLTNKNY